MMEKRYTFPVLFLLAATSTAWAQHVGFPPLRDKGGPAPASHVVAPMGQYRSDPIWSDDLSDPSHWVLGTLDGTANNWVIGTTPPSGAYAIDTIQSTTAANGFALFDSDLMCGPDNGYLALASSVDLSGVDHVQLQFEQFYRRFQGQTFIDVSADGANWTTIEVNAQLITGAYTPNPALTTVDISAVAGGQPTVWFRFRYVGNCDYAWMVDDVALVEQPAHELALVSASTTSWDFNTAASFDSIYYSIFPPSELRPLAVNMTLFNAGYEPANGVTAHITTSDGYDETGDLGTIAPGDTVTWFGPQWTPTYVPGTHSIQFSAAMDSAEADTANNSASMAIGVSEDLWDTYIMARDNGALQTAVGDGDQGYKVGSWFHFRYPHVISYLMVALASTSGSMVEVNGQILDANRNLLVETGYHTVMENELSGPGEANWIYLTFDSWPYLEPGDYFFAFQHFGGVEMWVGASGTSAEQSSLLYRASEDTWYSISPTPMIRVVMDPEGGIGEQRDAGLAFRAWPNPASTSVQLEYELERPGTVRMILRDPNGRAVRILASGPESAGKHNVELDTRDLAAGVYSVALRTATGTATRKLVVMH
jgi:hypothetical protein